MTEKIYWNRLSATEKRHLWRSRHPAVPPEYLPGGMLPWEHLSEAKRARCWHDKDPRVPPDWQPTCKQGVTRPWEDLSPTQQFKLWQEGSPRVPPGWKPTFIPEGAGAHKQLQRVYLEPAAAVVDLTPALLSLPEADLWAVLLNGWDEQGISPRRVIFRLNGQRVLEMDNPDLRSGTLPRPVLK